MLGLLHPVQMHPQAGRAAETSSARMVLLPALQLLRTSNQQNVQTDAMLCIQVIPPPQLLAPRQLQ
jgi:hypothetical protein